MPWQSRPPVTKTVAYLPRDTARRRWPAVAMDLGLVAVLAGFLLLAGPAAALLLHLATILLTIALVAGVIAFAAFRIGIAPHPRSRRLG